MTTEQALSVLQHASAAAALPLLAHQQVQEALKILTEALKND